MDRKNYDRSTISVFDVIGSFFVDVFYNGHYLLSREMVKSGCAQSITDAYRSTIINYMSGITTRKDLYMKVVKELHKYYQKSSGAGITVFSEFENRILMQFIPPEFYRDFTEKHKDNTLHEIIVKTTNEFGNIILCREIFGKIIDDHKNTANVSYLQDRIVDIFIYQREDYYARFAEEISKKNTGGGKISKKLFDQLKKEFVNEKKRRCEAESDRDRAVGMISGLMKKISQIECEFHRLLQKDVATKSTNVPTPIITPTYPSSALTLPDKITNDLCENEKLQNQKKILRMMNNDSSFNENDAHEDVDIINMTDNNNHINNDDASASGAESSGEDEVITPQNRKEMITQRRNNLQSNEEENQPQVHNHNEDPKVSSDITSIIYDDPGFGSG